MKSQNNKFLWAFVRGLGEQAPFICKHWKYFSGIGFNRPETKVLENQPVWSLGISCKETRK